MLGGGGESNLLTLKGAQHLIFPAFNITRQSHFEENDHQLKEAVDCLTNSPYQHLSKRIENSMENVHTDYRV